MSEKKTKTLMTLIILILTVSFTQLTVGAPSDSALENSGSVTVGSSGNVFHTPITVNTPNILYDAQKATVSVYTDGVNYYAKNETTGLVQTTSTNASYLVNSLVANGSSILFAAGTYQFNAPIAVSGNLFTSFAGQGNSTILNMTASSTGPIFAISSDGFTTIANMKLQNLNPPLTNKLIQLVTPASNVYIQNLVLNDTGPSSSDAINSWGYPTPVRNLQVLNCQINVPFAFGIYLHYTYNVLVDGNQFLSVAYAALGSESESFNVTAENNVVNWSGDTGFDFELVDANCPNYSTWTYSIIDNTIIRTHGSAIFCIDSHNGLIAGNHILNSTGVGGNGAIVFATDTNVPSGNDVNGSIIYGNVISDVYYGINAYGENGRTISNVIIMDNSISNCQNSGIILGGWSSYLYIKDNNVSDTSLSLKNQFDGITNEGAGYSVFSGNIISNSNSQMRNGYWEDWYDYNNITDNIFQGIQYAVNITSGATHDTISGNIYYSIVKIQVSYQ